MRDVTTSAVHNGKDAATQDIASAVARQSNTPMPSNGCINNAINAKQRQLACNRLPAQLNIQRKPYIYGKCRAKATAF